MTEQLLDVPVQLTLRGATPRGPVADAVRKIEHVLRKAPATVQRAKVVISDWSAATVVKRKTYSLLPLTPDEAAGEMELLDHDFYLFTDAETGADALVYRRHNGSYGVLGPIAGMTGPPGSGTRPPALTPAQARQRLALTADRFLFFRDPDDDRGRVLYRRYDGCFGLLIAS